MNLGMNRQTPLTLALSQKAPVYTQVLNSSFSKGFCYKPMQKSPLGRGRGGLVHGATD